ncbi:MAG: Succinyl-CoA ligase [ADP-forming] beta chain [Firmicutes bacterium]|nr:Succinyl-CoA ligase [ADP-forming] beta chain [Bacillota bacterium]
MRILEYEGKELLRKYGITVPKGFTAKSEEEVKRATEILNKEVVVKAMIPVGGRGKAGLVKIASNPEMAGEMSGQILGRKHGGYVVDTLIVEEAVRIEHEYYISVILDDNLHIPVLIFSPEGGMDIEQVSKDNPELLIKFPVCPDDGFIPYSISDSLINFGINFSLAIELEKIGRKLARIFSKEDLLLAEINPLVLDVSGNLIAADCKLEIDDSALLNHPEYINESDSLLPLEREVKAKGGTLVSLEGGDIGIICNGAGMGMAMTDMLINAGLKPANFLDTGGGTTRKKIKDICQIMFKQNGLKGIIINFWGSIAVLDEIAKGIIDVCEENKPSFPLVVRLFGNNQDRAMDLLDEANIQTARVVCTEEAISILADAIKGRS